MKIAIVSREYPTVQENYQYAFVHRRVANYPEWVDTSVFVPSARIDIDYDFEGVNVSIRSGNNLKQAIIGYEPDIIFAHAPISRGLAIHFDVIEILLKIYKNNNTPVVPFLHGGEALRKSKYYSNRPHITRLAHRLPRQAFQLYKIRKLIKTLDRNGYPSVFVSNWLKRAVEDSIKYKITNYKIIPNPVDEDLFSYGPKAIEDVYKMLSIRPMDVKYANDITIKAVGPLEDGHLNHYGKGPLFDNMVELAKNVGAEVTFHPEFLTQKQIAKKHSKHGLYLSPSRTDAQGVSMCEAMASGLAVITTPTQGIPEFVQDGKTGFLCEGHLEMEQTIRNLQKRPEKMIEVGKKSSDYILSKCGSSKIVERDISLADKLR